jgi:putative peptidoglycan lipid II flippase
MLRSSAVVGFFSLLGSLTGILVETGIAAHLGLSTNSDTFYVAFTVPYIITNLISATGQFSLVPFFASFHVRQAAEDLWRGLSYAVNIVLLGLTAIALVGAAAAPWLVRGIAPGLTQPQIALAAHLARWLFFIIIPAGVAETFRSFLLSQHRFALPSAAGFCRNSLVIAAIILSFDRLSTWSIVLGYFAGYFVQLIVLAGQTWFSFPVRHSWVLKGSDKAFRDLRGAGGAQLASALGWQGVVVVERIISSFLPPGTLTALNYGFKIMTTLAELLAGSVGTAALPTLSRAFARQSPDEERQALRATLEISLVLVSPIVIFCLLLDRNIIRLVFERGNFTAEATELMARVFFYYSLSLLLFGGLRILNFYLFARNQAGLFLRLALFQYVLNVILDLLFVGALGLGATGIPLGLLTSLLLTAALAWQRNAGDLKTALDHSLRVFAFKILIGSGLTALVIWGLGAWVGPPLTGLGNFLYVTALCGTGSGVFLAVAGALKAVPVSQFAALWQSPKEP